MASSMTTLSGEAGLRALEVAGKFWPLALIAAGLWIVVRRAGEGEKFKTLDDQERTLTSRMLLIADETKAVALAGVSALVVLRVIDWEDVVRERGAWDALVCQPEIVTAREQPTAAPSAGYPVTIFDHGLTRFRMETTETAGLYNTVGFNDDTRAFPSIPARHALFRRVDANWIAG